MAWSPCVAALLVSAACDHPLLVRDAEYAAGDAPTCVALGDLDRDGHLDVVAADFGDESFDLMIRPGRGDGTFGPAAFVPMDAAPRVVELADFDHDGRLDAAVGFFTEMGSLRILPGHGDGTFGAPTSYDAGFRAYRLRIADVNDDDHPDVLVLGQASTDVSVCLGRGDGSFEDPFAYGVLVRPRDLAVGDLDADGVLDLVTCSDLLDTLSILRGNGDGTFAFQEFFPVERPLGLAAADLDGDGDDDLAVSSDGAIKVFANKGAGGLHEIGTYPVHDRAGWFLVVDLDRNGALDLVVAVDRSTNDISVLLGRGDGTFDDAVQYFAGLRPVAVAAGDLNGDGAPDLVMPLSGGDAVGVMLNRCGCPADFDASRSVGFEDLLALLSAWGPCSPCREDLDGNDVVDFADLLLVLDAWGPCP